jgi:penicillin amidase
VPGWDGEHEWTGYIPFGELPRVYDPAEGFIVTANNRVVGPDYPHFISAEWSAGYRARRIEEVLRGLDRVSLDDCRALQMDFTCLPADDLLPFLADLSPTDPLEQQALDALQAWDRRATADSVGASVYEALVIHLLRQTFAPLLGEHVDHFLGIARMPLFPIGSFGGRAWETLVAALRGDTDVVTPDVPRAFSATVVALRKTLGPDVGTWQWGKLHQVHFKHAMGDVPVVGRLLSRGPYPVGGDGQTSPQAGFSVQWPVGPVTVCVSYRQVIDVGAWENCVSVNTTGQCGVPGNPHYADQIPLWREGRYHPMLWRREDIECEAEGTLIMEP